MQGGATSAEPETVPVRCRLGARDLQGSAGTGHEHTQPRPLQAHASLARPGMHRLSSQGWFIQAP